MIRSIKTTIFNSSCYKKAAEKAYKAQQRIFNALPDKCFKNTKFNDSFEKIGKEISSAENRLILGITALMSQPFIDGRNKNVDEKTRKVSVARTVAKIIAGTATGYLIRKGCIKAVKNWSKIPEPGTKIKKIEKFFTPRDVKSSDTDAYKQYHNAMGTITALIAMMITNFVIDAPLTKFLTNRFIGAQGGKNETSK